MRRLADPLLWLVLLYLGLLRVLRDGIFRARVGVLVFVRGHARVLSCGSPYRPALPGLRSGYPPEARRAVYRVRGDTS